MPIDERADLWALGVIATKGRVQGIAALLVDLVLASLLAIGSLTTVTWLSDNLYGHPLAFMNDKTIQEIYQKQAERAADDLGLEGPVEILSISTECLSPPLLSALH